MGTLTRYTDYLNSSNTKCTLVSSPQNKRKSLKKRVPKWHVSCKGHRSWPLESPREMHLIWLLITHRLDNNICPWKIWT